MTTTQWICLILLIIFMGIAIWYLRYCDNKIIKHLNDGNKDNCIDFFCTARMMFFFFGYFISILIFGVFDLTFTPTAMDVYKGKTELQYTIRNGEIVDSIAVYK